MGEQYQQLLVVREDKGKLPGKVNARGECCST